MTPPFANFVYGASKIAVLRLYLCEGGITENEPSPSQSFGTYCRFLPQAFVCQKLCERKNFGPRNLPTNLAKIDSLL